MVLVSCMKEKITAKYDGGLKYSDQDMDEIKGGNEVRRIAMMIALGDKI